MLPSQDMPLDPERLSSSELNTLRRRRDTFTEFRLAQAERSGRCPRTA